MRKGQAVAVTFYSLYMHLHAVRSTVTAGRTINRKAELGDAGYIYGQPSRIHFEIFCDNESLQRFVGRASGDLPLDQHGRADVLFGELYFRLAGTTIYAAQPAANVVTPTVAATYAATQDLIIGLRYAQGGGAQGQQGDATVTAYHADGSIEGTPLRETEAEYALYTSANSISTAYPAAGRPAPSAVYEVLRLGRVVNTEEEALTPADLPHWRKVRYPGGEGWVNLNASTVRKFSDADFPPWKRWSLIDDSADQDSRCDSATVLGWLDTNLDHHVDAQESAAAQADASVAERLSYAICRFPTEWDGSTLDARWGWLKTATPENPDPLTETDFAAFKRHAEALCFWAQVPVQTPALPANPWRFHPRAFIELFRRCGWLSHDELASTFPKYQFYNSSGNPRTAITTANATYTLTRATARTRIAHHAYALNRCIQKYIGPDPKRIAIFLSQVLLETAQWRNPGGNNRLMHEWGYGAYSAANPATQYYTAFYGRGMMQLTWAGNYKAYGEYRHLADHTGAYIERRPLPSPRITATSQHYNANPNDGGVQSQWAPRYDPDIIGEQPYEACDSGGFYWISKSFSEGLKTDSTDDSADLTINPPAPKAAVRANMARTE
ncbi:hydroxyethylthiazole kinase [Ideonella azotifigens]|uniref:Uncharacterized protein n=1 Tax=Ideonella azotifigens TaxID=513160 RepID=A0ABN1K213_9BURK|nr:hydroxyethylthiazole kinase [Ideonella azotifigens]MCD2341530.1 hydroxyethylthiazole kinase [Ideonella azotifigens]